MRYLVKIIETLSRMVGGRGWGEEAMDSYGLMGIKMQFYKLKRVMEGIPWLSSG